MFNTESYNPLKHFGRTTFASDSDLSNITETPDL